MRELTFLINPVAGTARRIRGLVSEVRRLRPEAEVLVAKRKGDLHDWARERRDAEHRAVIGVGGDGTVHQVGNGLVGGRAVFGVYAAGSGNDFAKMLSVPKGLEAAVQFFESAQSRPCDVGQVEIHHIDGTVTEFFFINSLGLGLEALVAETAARTRFLYGSSRYLFAALRHLLTFRPLVMRILHDNQEFEQRQFLVAVGNGCCAGGNFRLFPQARIDDGLFELVWADTRSRFRLLRILPTVFNGRHLSLDDIYHERISELRVDCATGCPVHADGELVAREARAVRINVLSGALRVLG